ncbi:folate-binding protein YgfZ [Telmatospirillum sp. J64-1]|uniref:CAF17-like 4Fe-4S cluster assembly/insertion protein YgfZ n=1 Tax=Telmatospirillum sp. J64-1 TaxID=2502183 RepID=UPI00115CBE7E|nr:folate-binding protein YgfZ [Telmatospirillum sp. J64-1]
MSDLRYVLLPHRGVLSLSGEDRRTFLQGLVSNDVTKVAPDRAIHAAFLTPQGKFLHEFFIIEQGDTLLLEGEAERLDDLRRRLSMYKLRSKVVIEVRPDLAVAALLGEGAEAAAAKIEGAAAFTDPRLAAAGARVLLPGDSAAASLEQAGFARAELDEWDRLRLRLGLPDGSRDMVIEKAILLENGFDELNGVDWKKGCYMGQELTARTKYRGLIKKRLMPVEIDGPAPAPGTPILFGEAEAGEMRSSAGSLGLAIIRLEYLDKDGIFTAGEARVTPHKPDWANF